MRFGWFQSSISASSDDVEPVVGRKRKRIPAIGRVNLESEEERISEVLTVYPKSRIAVTGQSIVFIMEDRLSGTEYVGKYYIDCLRRGLISSMTDPEPNFLKHEYALLRQLEGQEVTPEVISLSQATEIDNFESQKVAANLLVANKQLCKERKSHVRLMLMERNGVDMEAYLQWLRTHQRNPVEYISAVVRLTIRFIDLIQKFHELGLVHGDVFSKNIVFKEPKTRLEDYDWKADRIHLIDLASTVPIETGKPDIVDDRTYVGMSPGLLSPWQLKNFRIGQRDDVFRIIETMAFLLGNGEQENGINRVVAEYWERQPEFRTQGDRLMRSVLYKYKSSANFFTQDPIFKGQCCRQMGLGERQLPNVQALLEAITLEARRPASPDDVPRYDVLRFLLRNVETFLVSE